MSKHRFHTDQIADVSTSEITERDCELIMDTNVPHHLASHDQGCGAIFSKVSEEHGIAKSLSPAAGSLLALGFRRTKRGGVRGLCLHSTRSKLVQVFDDRVVVCGEFVVFANGGV